MSPRIESAEGVVVPRGYQQLTSFSTVQTLIVPDGCYFALIQPETNDVRVRDDGVAPTATVGQRLYVGQMFKYTGGPAGLKALQIIPTTASAVVNVLYYGSP